MLDKVLIAVAVVEHLVVGRHMVDLLEDMMVVMVQQLDHILTTVEEVLLDLLPQLLVLTGVVDLEVLILITINGKQDKVALVV